MLSARRCGLSGGPTTSAAEPARRARHELHHADRADAGDGRSGSSGSPATRSPGRGTGRRRSARRAGRAGTRPRPTDGPPPPAGRAAPVPGTRSTRPTRSRSGSAMPFSAASAARRCRSGRRCPPRVSPCGRCRSPPRTSRRTSRTPRRRAGTVRRRAGHDAVRVRDAVGPRDGGDAGAVAGGDRAERVAGPDGHRALRGGASPRPPASSAARAISRTARRARGDGRRRCARGA